MRPHRSPLIPYQVKPAASRSCQRTVSAGIWLQTTLGRQQNATSKGAACHACVLTSSSYTTHYPSQHLPAAHSRAESCLAHHRHAASNAPAPGGWRPAAAPPLQVHQVQHIIYHVKLEPVVFRSVRRQAGRSIDLCASMSALCPTLLAFLRNINVLRSKTRGDAEGAHIPISQGFKSWSTSTSYLPIPPHYSPAGHASNTGAMSASS